MPNTPNANAQRFSVRNHDRKAPEIPTRQRFCDRFDWQRAVLAFRIHGPAGRGSGVMAEPKETLKPCPFCGGEATAMDMETYRTTPSWSAFCNQEPCRFEGGFGGYSTEAKAIAAWNTRADASENAALREKLAEREALIKATESAAFEKAAKVLDQAGMEWAGLREGVYFDRLAKEIRALTGGDNAEG